MTEDKTSETRKAWDILPSNFGKSPSTIAEETDSANRQWIQEEAEKDRAASSAQSKAYSGSVTQSTVFGNTSNEQGNNDSSSKTTTSTTQNAQGTTGDVTMDTENAKDTVKPEIAKQTRGREG